MVGRLFCVIFVATVHVAVLDGVLIIILTTITGLHLVRSICSCIFAGLWTILYFCSRQNLAVALLIAQVVIVFAQYLDLWHLISVADAICAIVRVVCGELSCLLAIGA